MALKQSTLKPFFLSTGSLEPPSKTPRVKLDLDQNESEDELSSESENEIEEESENEIVLQVYRQLSHYVLPDGLLQHLQLIQC